MPLFPRNLTMNRNSFLLFTNQSSEKHHKENRNKKSPILKKSPSSCVLVTYQHVTSTDVYWKLYCNQIQQDQYINLVPQKTRYPVEPHAPMEEYVLLRIHTGTSVRWKKNVYKDVTKE